MNMTDKQAIELMETYEITQTEVANRLGITKNAFYKTYHRMKSGGYTSASRGAVDRAKQAIADILEEKGVIIK